MEQIQQKDNYVMFGKNLGYYNYSCVKTDNYSQNEELSFYGL